MIENNKQEDKEIDFGKDSNETYLSHSDWTDEEEIDGEVERVIYFNKDKESIENVSSTILNSVEIVPFDDDINLRCNLGDLRLSLIQQYLYDIKSDLYEDALKLSLDELARSLNIIEAYEKAVKLKNIGVLLFTEKPKTFIPGSYIELVHFENSSSDNTFIEKIFDGPIHEQIRGVLRYIESYVVKSKNIGNDRVFNYPLEAVKEAIVNAVYHKNYTQKTPIEVRIDKEKIVVISYPGPDKIIKKEDIDNGKVLARIYRNTRIGEFLKELNYAHGKATGLSRIIKVMHRNYSPNPIFETNYERSYFLVKLYANTNFIVEKVLKEEMLVKVKEEEKQVKEERNFNVIETKILELLSNGPLSRKEIATALGYKVINYNVKNALDRLLNEKLIDYTIKDMPSNRKQKYKLL